ncbi:MULTISPECIES: glycosyltransferase [Aestuariimicrobium]|uniref:glycosyltransferase n=1 Tax=Aestuariimicrobium TaxID=396388 RepID=UPI0003B49F21|nr:MULTISPECIES: glycosyltransferase [Aestuariimicrobium]CAI9406257.1 D-inositol-3-phosphate glycosyltransferase [Aestuariimicrobium sp. T2.26MG-19.2B]
MTSPRRRRVVIGAYACGPLEEPEAGAGWAHAVAAAATSDVWVVTRRRFAESVEAARRADPELARHLTVTYIDLSDRVMALRRHDWDMYWYYLLWQRQLARTVRGLHAQHHFDVAHHVTFANDWLLCGLAGLEDVPLVWGPVGGASDIPYWRLRQWLGLKGLRTEIVRDLVTTLPRAVWGESAAKRASLVVAQNADVARRFARFADTVVEPNAALEPVDLANAPRRVRAEGPRTAVFAGRLIGLKGVRLAIDAVARTPAQAWRLVVYGDGPDRELLIERARRLGIADRVEFRGHRPRTEVLSAFASADAMLFPSMHDQAGWVAGEASSLGCPVVCLPLGGPPLLAGPNAFVASLDGDIVANVAEQLERAGEAGGTRHNRWSHDRLPDLVDGWYRRATGAGSS